MDFELMEVQSVSWSTLKELERRLDKAAESYAAGRLDARAFERASATIQRAPTIAASQITCKYRSPVTSVFGGGRLPIHSGFP